MEELLMRVQAVLRRSNKSRSSDQSVRHFNIGTYRFDSETQVLQHNKQEQRLTTKENQLLRLLCIHQNEILDRTFALKSIWKDDNYFNGRSMDVYIAKLRKYLKDDASIEIINVHGKAFKLLIHSWILILVEYLNPVQNPELLTQALQQAAEKTLAVFSNTQLNPEFCYAAGKWTPLMILQHLIDTERVFLYRALSFSRKDPQALPGFDENRYAETYPLLKLNLKKALNVFQITRNATVAFFNECALEMYMYSGKANQHTRSVNELGWSLVNHNLHHINVINKLYLV